MGGPREGSLSCLTVSRKGNSKLLGRVLTDSPAGMVMHGASRVLLCRLPRKTQHNDPGIGSPGERVR